MFFFQIVAILYRFTLFLKSQSNVKHVLHFHELFQIICISNILTLSGVPDEYFPEKCELN
jgi:hypothetical protein